jgi:hypothetical protein
VDDLLQPPPAEPKTPSRVARRLEVRRRFVEKLPEILLEGASVVFAILLAFAVDEWREERAQRALAARARTSILAELRANRDEIKENLASNRKVLESLQRQIRGFKQGKTKEVTAFMNLAQPSAAAFQAAQSTQALQFVDFGWLVLVGRTYEIQRTYMASQEVALVEVGGSGGAIESGDKPVAVLHRINSRVSTLQQLGEGLVKAYDEVLSK